MLSFSIPFSLGISFLLTVKEETRNKGDAQDEYDQPDTKLHPQVGKTVRNSKKSIPHQLNAYDSNQCRNHKGH